MFGNKQEESQSPDLGISKKKVESNESQAKSRIAKAISAASMDNCKDSLSLQAAMNDIGMAKLRDRILVSKSTDLTKDQRTRLSQKTENEEIERKKKEQVLETVLSKGSSTKKLISSHLKNHTFNKESAADEIKRRWQNIVKSSQLTENLSRAVKSNKTKDKPTLLRSVEESLSNKFMGEVNWDKFQATINNQRFKLDHEVMLENNTNDMSKEILRMFDYLHQPVDSSNGPFPQFKYQMKMRKLGTRNALFKNMDRAYREHEEIDSLECKSPMPRGLN